jgi:hypothetical protein
MPPGVMGVAGRNTVDQKYLDALTGEDVTKDWEFVVLFAVVLDPPASMLPAPAPATPDGATNPPAGGSK